MYIVVINLIDSLQKFLLDFASRQTLNPKLRMLSSVYRLAVSSTTETVGIRFTSELFGPSRHPWKVHMAGSEP